LLFFIISAISEPDIEFSTSEESPLISSIKIFKEFPLNLNTCSLRQLKKIPYITDEIAENIYQYRKIHKFNDTSELLLISGITPLIYERIKDFFILKGKVKPRKNKIEARGQYYQEKGIKNWERITIKNNLISLRMISEKDREETDYFDYLSGNIVFEKYNLIIGDYDINLGQGLCFSSQIFSFPLYGIPRIKSGIIPHTTSIENLFYRGFAFENRHILFGISRNGIDAKGDSISIPYPFGPHTGNITKNGITEDAGVLFLKFSPFSFGGGYFSYAPDIYGYKTLFPFDMIFEKTFSSQTLSMEGIYLKHPYFAGRFSVNKNPYFLFFYRYLSDSLPVHSGMYHRFSRGDEEGLYIYLGVRTVEELRFNGYFDTYHHLTDRENYFIKYGVNVSYPLLKGLFINGYLSGSSKYIKIRGQMDISGKYLNIRLRIEEVNKHTEPKNGICGYISINLKSIMEIRYVAFHNPSNLPMYEYERDLPGIMRNVYLTGDGRRYYILLHKKFKGNKIVFKIGLNDKEKMSFSSGIYGGFRL